MKGNETEGRVTSLPFHPRGGYSYTKAIWIASLTTWNFVTVQSNLWLLIVKGPKGVRLIEVSLYTWPANFFFHYMKSSRFPWNKKYLSKYRKKYLWIGVVNFRRSFLRQIELQLLELFNTCWRDNNFCYHWDETEILHIRRFEEKIAWFYGNLLCDFSNMIMPQKRKRSTLIISYSQSNHGQWPISIASSW